MWDWTSNVVSTTAEVTFATGTAVQTCPFLQVELIAQLSA
jgi:hypothetical protein